MNKCILCRTHNRKDGSKYCQYCFDDKFSPVVHSASYAPRRVMFHGESSKVPYFGFELEICYNDNVLYDGYARNIVDRIPFVYAKRDGSLDNGFEVVSYPISEMWFYKKKISILKLLSAIRSTGAFSLSSQCCGMHIHVNKSSISELHLYKLITFFNNEKEFILHVSQRNQRRLEQYARFYTYKEDKSIQNKYSAIRTNKDKTYEFRIFEGTITPYYFFKNFEFVFSIINFTKNCGVRELNYAKYKKYLEKSKYTIINDFLERYEHEEIPSSV